MNPNSKNPGNNEKPTPLPENMAEENDFDEADYELKETSVRSD